MAASLTPDVSQILTALGPARRGNEAQVGEGAVPPEPAIGPSANNCSTEAGQEWVVFLDQVVLEVLTAWAATQMTEKAMWGSAYNDDGCGWVFTREDGQLLHPDRVTKVASRLLRQHGLETTLHGLRRFWAAALISSAPTSPP